MPGRSAITLIGNNSKNNESDDHITADEHNRRLKQDLIDRAKSQDYNSKQEDVDEDGSNGKKFTKQISSNSGSKNKTSSALEKWKNKNRKKAYNPK